MRRCVECTVGKGTVDEHVSFLCPVIYRVCRFERHTARLRREVSEDTMFDSNEVHVRSTKKIVQPVRVEQPEIER